MKKLWALVVALLLVAVAVGCGKKQQSTKLSIWAFTDELKKVVDDFKAANEGIDVSFSIIPSEEFRTKIRPVLRSGSGAPDVFLGEVAWVRDIVSWGMWMDLTKNYPDMVKQYEDQAPPYVVDLGRDENGHVVAMSWQACPGGFFYKRSVAKNVFGTDDPKAIGELISTPEKFLDAARTLKSKNVKMLTGFSDYQWIPFYGRKAGWVDSNNNLFIDPVAMDFFELAKTLRQEGLTAKVDQWSPGWFGNMAKKEVFGYLLPTWGLHYVIKKNAGDTAGDWAVTRGPASYSWGGTWLGIYKNAEAEDLAVKFVNMLAVDADYQEAYTREVGDFMSNLNVDAKMAKEEGDPFLGGQNHYQFFMEEAKNITPGLETKYDQDINGMYIDAIRNYIEDKMTKEEAIADMKGKVKNAFPEINVD
ncbi:MAG TPA: ABC transporter substrate-binding protein [Spirochaetota bacterium]|nr:ABC transporter substrate-binding protein [Spirochaetota bacterium]